MANMLETGKEVLRTARDNPEKVIIAGAAAVAVGVVVDMVGSNVVNHWQNNDVLARNKTEFTDDQQETPEDNRL